MPNGDKLEGIFSGSWGSSIRISGHFHRIEIAQSIPRTPESPLTPLDPGWGQGFPPYKDHAKAILRLDFGAELLELILAKFGLILFFQAV